MPRRKLPITETRRFKERAQLYADGIAYGRQQAEAELQRLRTEVEMLKASATRCPCCQKEKCQ
jgi:hypothetical protein